MWVAKIVFVVVCGVLSLPAAGEEKKPDTAQVCKNGGGCSLITAAEVARVEQLIEKLTAEVEELRGRLRAERAKTCI